MENRDTLRNSVVETLMNTFPTAQKVNGGVAFMSDVLDEETGKYFPVELKVTVKNTAPTARSEAYSLDKAVADFAARPGRKVADPARVANALKEKEAIAARKAANTKILADWVAANPVNEMTTSEIHDAIPEFASVMVPYVGTLLKVMAEEGTLTVSVDEKGKKHYSK